MKTTRDSRVILLLLILIHLHCGLQAAGQVGNRNMNMNRMPNGNMNQRNMQLNNQNYQNQINPNVDSREEYKVRNAMSQTMEKYMNLSVDPCVNFYDYACGNWPRYHTRRLREGELGIAQQLVESRILGQLQELLRMPVPTPNHPNEYSPTGAANVRKVCNFYDSCLAVDANGNEQRQFLRQILQNNGGLRDVPNSNYKPDVSWLQILIELRKNYGLDILIGLSIDLNLQQMGGNSIYLGEPEQTIIPAEHCNAMATQQANVRDEIYEQLQQQVADNMNDWFGMERGNAARFAGDIVRFEFELCKKMREQATDQQQESEQPTAYAGRSRTGQERLRKQSAGNSAYPRLSLIELTSKLGNSINFKYYVEKTLERNYMDDVYLRSQNYLIHLVKTAANANNQHTIPGYILYLAMLALSQPAEELTLLRPQQCVLIVQRLFPQVLGDMYQRQVQQSDAQNDINEVFNDLIKSFEQMLKVDWLTENDRRTARSRLQQYRLQFPNYQDVDLSQLHFQKTDDFWRKLDITLRYNAQQKLNLLNEQSTEDIVNAFEVKAGLLPRKQTVLVGWGLLQAPFYNLMYPKALKYAYLGHRLASALLLAFDDEGWNNYPQATATWNEQTMESYRNVSECQRAQYSSYLSNDPSEFRNATRLREIIAKGSALNVAFRAYLDWLELQDPKISSALARETLPDLNFTSTQLFFIYFAQTHCWARNGEEPAPDAMPLMQHTPERWDVNGPLSNTEEFGLEFGCALGSPMNSGNKCLVY